MFRKGLKKGSKIFQNDAGEDSIPPIKIELPKKRGISSKELCNVEGFVVSEDFVCKKFVKEKSGVEKVREKNLEKHIQRVLEGSQEVRAEEFVIPEKYRPDNSRLTEGGEKSLWLAGLVEVPLSVEHKIDNIEATEAATRRAIKGEGVFSTRFGHLHQQEYETFTQNMMKSKNFDKEIQRIEKKMTLRGQKYKRDKEARIKMNEMYEEAWRS